MNTNSDRLPPSHVARIQRLQLARYQKARRESIRAWLPIWCFLCGIWLVIGLACYIVDQRWNPGTELYTRLPANLDDQEPSITVYGGD